MKYSIIKCLEWRNWVIPKLLYDRPVHRWFVFPHSFTDDIVKVLKKEWELGENDKIMDPFSGAGTTVLAAKQASVPAVGFDLSPLAVMTGRVKVSNYNFDRLRKHWQTLKKDLKVYDSNGEEEGYPELVSKALPGKKLSTFHMIKKRIFELKALEFEQSFFLLALLSQVPKFSNAVSTGGWLSWESNYRQAAQIPKAFQIAAEQMMTDVKTSLNAKECDWQVEIADARQLPMEAESCSAVITSPPYPNRHDYTRVFGVELMFAFLDWEKTRELRYQTFHSHPEAKPSRPQTSGYHEPALISRAINRAAQSNERERIISMLHGYFLDVHLSLKEVHRALKAGGHAAFVLGNAQYGGVAIEVDKATAEIGEQVGLRCLKILVVRERGNSAQQMKCYGRNPSRESIVIFEKP